MSEYKKKCPCGFDVFEYKTTNCYTKKGIVLGYKVKCSECGCTMGCWHNTKEEADKMWNDRPIEDELNKKIKSLDDQIVELFKSFLNVNSFIQELAYRIGGECNKGMAGLDVGHTQEVMFGGIDKLKEKLTWLESTRAGKLLISNKPFLVVKYTETYADSVYRSIREEEKEKGTWSKEDEDNYIKFVVELPITNH